jgi:hypothetical protein
MPVSDVMRATVIGLLVDVAEAKPVDSAVNDRAMSVELRSVIVNLRTR